MSKRIAHVLCSTKVGGLEDAYKNTTNALISLGHEVVAMIPDVASYVPNGVQCFDFNPRGYYDLFTTLKARKFLKSKNIDAVITHNARATSVIAKARAGLDIPHIAFSHSYKTRRMHGCDVLIALTDHMKDHFKADGFKDIRVLPNMLPDFPQKTLSLRANDGRINIGFIGRMSKEKGLECLLDAVRGCDYRLHIAGCDVLPKNLDVMGVNYQIDGWIDDVREWLSKIDLLVVPSKSETFGMVILQAMAHGKPIISSKTAGGCAQIEHSKTGWLYDDGDLRRAIKNAISCRNEWGDIVTRAHESAKKYDAKLLIPKLGEIIS